MEMCIISEQKYHLLIVGIFLSFHLKKKKIIYNLILILSVTIQIQYIYIYICKQIIFIRFSFHLQTYSLFSQLFILIQPFKLIIAY